MIFELTQNFHDAIATMPADHPKHRMLELLEEAVRRDIQFIDRHPTTLFQCMWNTCQWNDCPNAAIHLSGSEAEKTPDDLNDLPRQYTGSRVFDLLSTWNQHRRSNIGSTIWLRSVCPPKDKSDVLILRSHQKCVSGLAYSPDGRLLASCSWDGSIRLWEAETGRETMSLLGHEADVNGIAFTPDGRLLISGSSDGTIRVWDVESGAEVRCLKVPPVDKMGISLIGGVTAVAVSGDGKRIACSTVADNLAAANQVILWNTSDWRMERKLLAVNSLEQSAGLPVRCLVFSSDGTWLMAGTGTVRDAGSVSIIPGDSFVVAWDLDDQSSPSITACLGQHKDVVWSLSVSPDGRQLISCSQDGTVGLWRMPDDLMTIGLADPCIGYLSVSEQPLNWIAFSPDGRRFAVADGNSTISIWSTSNKQKQFSLSGHHYWVACVAFSRDGQRMASGSYDSTIRIWKNLSQSTSSKRPGHKDKIQNIAVHDGSSRVATSSNDYTVRVWDAESGLQLFCLNHDGWVEGVAWSPDGQMLASGANDETARIWDATNGKIIWLLRGHDKHVSNVVFSPDGRYLVTISNDKYVLTWDVKTGKQLVSRYAGAVPWCVAISAHGSRIAAGTALGRVRVWPMESDEMLFEMDAHGEGVVSVSFSQDGRIVAGGTEEGNVFLWDSSTGDEFGRLEGHGNIVTSVAFSSNSKKLVAVGGTIGNRMYGVTKIWDIREGACLATLPGFADGTAIAQEATLTPLVVTEKETEMRLLDTNLSMAFWPDQLHGLKLGGTKRFWVGAVGDYLCIIQPEGGEILKGCIYDFRPCPRLS